VVSFPTGIGILSLAIWLYLIALRGGYWRASERLSKTHAAPPAWPAVIAIVPARNEADVIGPAITSLLTQDYPGRLDVVLVDDHSNDDTARHALQAAKDSGRAEALRIVQARPLPAGWSGKLWALAEGAEHVQGADFLWLSDADIAHEPDNLRRLVGKAVAERRDLVSLMVALSCRGAWERLLIPPFVYFFQMLYPFPWVNDARKRTAAAAGGCVLLRREALEQAGGFAAIKGELIDDCALARLIKHRSPQGSRPGGNIWIGLATTAQSIRPYQGLGEIWRMVARSAYTQLRHSPVVLAGTLAALVLTFLVPPALVLTAPVHGDVPAALAGLAAWVLMTASAWPTFALYRQSTWLTGLLPVAAAFYCAMTFDSALRHWRGRGGAWKGRVHPATVEERQSKL